MDHTKMKKYSHYHCSTDRCMAKMVTIINTQKTPYFEGGEAWTYEEGKRRLKISKNWFSDDLNTCTMRGN